MIVFLLGYFSAAKYLQPFATTNSLLEELEKEYKNMRMFLPG